MMEDFDIITDGYIIKLTVDNSEKDYIRENKEEADHLYRKLLDKYVEEKYEYPKHRIIITMYLIDTGNIVEQFDNALNI